MKKERTIENYKAPCVRTIAVSWAEVICTSLWGQTEDLDNPDEKYEW